MRSPFQYMDLNSDLVTEFSGELKHGTCHFYTRYTGIWKIYSVYGNLKTRWNVILCQKPICGCGYQLALISIKLILGIYRRRGRRRRWLIATKLATLIRTKDSSIHGNIWKNQQLPKVFLHDAKNHKCRPCVWKFYAVRHYACYKSNTNKRNYLLPESFGILWW